ncbi:hypothetical protein HN873_060099, partial [Arachis hypogaea]
VGWDDDDGAGLVAVDGAVEDPVAAEEEAGSDAVAMEARFLRWAAGSTKNFQNKHAHIHEDDASH